MGGWGELYTFCLWIFYTLQSCKQSGGNIFEPLLQNVKTKYIFISTAFDGYLNMNDIVNYIANLRRSYEGQTNLPEYMGPD